MISELAEQFLNSELTLTDSKCHSKANGLAICCRSNLPKIGANEMDSTRPSFL